MRNTQSKNKKENSTRNFPAEIVPQLGQVSENTPLDENFDLDVPPQNVQVKARITPKSRKPENSGLGQPAYPQQNASQLDAEDLPRAFQDVFDAYDGDDLQCIVSRYLDPGRSEKKAYSMEFPFNPETVMKQTQEAHPEGGEFKFKISNADGSFVEEYEHVAILPTLAYRRPNPQPFQQQPQQTQPQLDPMAFMKPMLEMQGVMFTQMQTVMQLNSTMMAGLMTQMESLNKIRPETQSPTAMLKEVMGLFGQVKEAQATIGGGSAADSDGPTTWVDVVNNVLTTSVERNPRLVERGLGVIEKLVGLDSPSQNGNQSQSKAADTEGEVIDEEDETPDQIEGETPIANQEELAKIQAEAQVKLVQLVSDWINNADPAPSAQWLKSYIAKYKSDPSVGQIPLLFMLPPETAFEQLRERLLGEEAYAALKQKPHTIEWLTKFIQIAK